MSEMRTYNIEALAKLLRLIEKVVKKRELNRVQHRSEVEKYFSYIIQGKDLLSAQDRRAAGVSDAEWNDAVLEFRKLMKEA